MMLLYQSLGAVMNPICHSPVVSLLGGGCLRGGCKGDSMGETATACTNTTSSTMY